MKRILLLAACVAMVSGAFAQEFQFGLKGGLNLANLSNGDKMFTDSKMKASLYVGAFGEYQISEFFGIQPEIVFSRQGFIGEESIPAGALVPGATGNVDMKTWIKLNYINIPILAKLYLADGLSLEVGPQFGFLIGNKYKMEMEYAGQTEDTDGKIDGDGEDDMGLELNKFDISVGLGLSYMFTPNIGASARYNLGLTEVNKDGDDKFKNNVIQIGVLYKF